MFGSYLVLVFSFIEQQTCFIIMRTAAATTINYFGILIERIQLCSFDNISPNANIQNYLVQTTQLKDTQNWKYIGKASLVQYIHY